MKYIMLIKDDFLNNKLTIICSLKLKRFAANNYEYIIDDLLSLDMFKET